MSVKSMTRLRELWRNTLRPLAALILVLTSFRSAIADWNDVPSGSMRPTIIEGDRIFVNKLAYGLKIPFTTIHLARWNTPQRGEIVVFYSPEQSVRMVKRVVGVPGDVIWMVNSHLFINGEPVRYSADNGRVLEQLGEVNHEVQSTPQIMAMRNFGPFRVPEGQYFVMGDNRDNSRDSRFYGTIALDQIVGRSSSVILSLDYDDYYLPRWDRFFKSLSKGI